VEKRAPSVESFYRYINEEKLMATKCLKCGRINLPPRKVCQECGSRNWRWIKLEGKGKLETYTVIHIPPTEFSEMAPYIVGIVRLDEGPRITAMILTNPDDVKVGMDVVATYVKYKGGKMLRFRVP